MLKINQLIFCIFLCFGLTPFVRGQNQHLEQLKTAYDQATDLRKKTKLGWSIGYEYFYEDTAKARWYLEKSLELALEQNNAYDLYQSYVSLSDYYLLRKQANEQLQFLKKAEEQAGKQNNEEINADLQLKYANHFKLVKEPEKAAQHYLQAIERYQKLKAWVALGRAYGSLAALYQQMGELGRTKLHYQNALQAYEQVPKKNTSVLLNLIFTYGNIATTFFETNIDSSIYYNSKALAYAQQLNDQAYLADTENNMATYYAKAERHALAKQYFQQALQRYEKLNNASGQANVKLHLAAVLAREDEDELAEKHLRYAIGVFKQLGQTENEKHAYRTLAEIQAKRQNFKAALEDYQAAQRLDSLQRQEQFSLQLIEIEDKYQAAKKTEEINLLQAKEKILALELEQKDNRLKRNAYLIALLSISLLGLWAIFAIRSKQKQLQQAKEAAELEHKALRAQMNPHFIFNALNSIQRKYIEGDLDQANEFMSDFADLMRRVLDNSAKPKVSLQDDLEVLKIYLNLENLRAKGKIQYEIVLDPQINPAQLLVPPFLLQPFVENAIWHGILPQKDGGLIRIQVERRSANRLGFRVEDNGQGIQAHKNPVHKHQSKGMAITEKRIGQKIQISSSPGEGTAIAFELVLDND